MKKLGDKHVLEEGPLTLDSPIQTAWAASSQPQTCSPLSAALFFYPLSYSKTFVFCFFYSLKATPKT